MKVSLKLAGQMGAVALLAGCAAGPRVTEFTAADRAVPLRGSVEAAGGRGWKVVHDISNRDVAAQ